MGTTLTSDSLKQLTDFVAKWEGFRATTYKDIAGIDTVGYGFIDKQLVAKHKTKPMSIAEGKRILLELIERNYLPAVYRLDKDHNLGLDANQIIALTSFAFNLGTATLSNLVKKRVEAVNSNQKVHSAIAEGIQRYNKARINGELTVSKGLSRRRNEEASLFLKRWTG